MTDDRVLVVGGAGFIGANLAHRLLSSGARVRVLDSLARPGVERNLAWLQATHGERLEATIADVRDAEAVARAVRGVSAVFHLAAQVAVTTSLVTPLHDFEVNARGTLNVLEAARREDPPPFVLFTSTNKVYGALEDVSLVDVGSRYAPVEPGLRRGISEARSLAFHSPYGCSKGAAEQYVLDWARTYGVPGTVFRMSCIYGPHQLGTEDQGWVAHFLLQAMHRRPITLYGDGKQVRDVLFVEDLLDAFLAARERPREVAGRAFNVGGGPENTVSLLELLELVAELEGVAPRVLHDGWRLADQRWYVSDPSSLGRLAGWAPRTGVREGVARLHAWLRDAARAPRPVASPAEAGSR
ncbi:SDR family NAD(P)-dependent oxidoreductase [Anaeromyxobacter oryzisoli]|uniref:SDR family NAD(P)-dependent oxidoreductase n=1 Tax=Anaeromyxobacter oryzisoli TaxID=2925408 RepID=UPI001F577F5B|nr:SDR family NAD(P)-dependent oxidoreductase [Anaeromyxobacter sp. SG63]